MEVGDVEDAEAVELGWEAPHGRFPLQVLDPLRLEERPCEPGRRDQRDGDEDPDEHLLALELAPKLRGAVARAAVSRHVARGAAPPGGDDGRRGGRQQREREKPPGHAADSSPPRLRGP